MSLSGAVISMSWTSKVVVLYISLLPSAQIVSSTGALLAVVVKGAALLGVMSGLLIGDLGCHTEGVVLIGDVVDGSVVPIDVLTSWLPSGRVVRVPLLTYWHSSLTSSPW